MPSFRLGGEGGNGRSLPGSIFLLVVAFSAVARVFLEAFRGDSAITAAGLRTAQLWGIVILALCLTVMKVWAGVKGRVG